jgi:protein-tyrosine phosphatase
MTVHAKPPFRRGRLRRALLLTVGLHFVSFLLVAGARYGYWSTVQDRISTIAPGRLYQSAEIAPEDLVERCRELGVTEVVDLRNTRPAQVEAEREVLVAAGIAHHHLPTGHQPPQEVVDAWLEILRHSPGRAVLVHCEYGESRSISLSAIYRMEFEGWSNEEALAGTIRLPDDLKFLGRLIPVLGTFRRSNYKGKYVLDYVRIEDR